MNRWHGIIGVLLGLVLGAAPAFSQAANFSELKLAPGFPAGAGQASGRTGGNYSLSSIANSDRNGKPCIGYGAQTPDHIIHLEGSFPKLTFQVTSGKDTTIVVKGPNNLILCGDDTGSNKDASVTAANLPSGAYSVWVGTVKEGQRWPYTLTVRQ